MVNLTHKNQDQQTHSEKYFLFILITIFGSISDRNQLCIQSRNKSNEQFFIKTVSQLWIQKNFHLSK